MSSRQVVEHGLGHLPFTEKQVVTPTGKLMKKIISYYNLGEELSNHSNIINSC